MRTTNEPFFIVPSKVFDYGLNPYELSVLFYLCMRADNETHTCWPSEKTMARDCGMGYSTIRRTIRTLKEKEMIEIRSKYQKSKNGMNRQTANQYQVKLFNKGEKTIFAEESIQENNCEIVPSENIPPAITEHYPSYDIASPLLSQSGEINKTKPNITKTNITKPTELSMACAEEELKERNSFLKLKEDCFEKLKNEYSLEEDYILLLDRALEHLWYKNSIEYEGKEYPKEAIQTLLATGITPWGLNASVESFEHSKEPVRSPVAYLAKCIFGMLVNGERRTFSKGDSAESTVSAKPKREESATSFGSLEVDDFFAAALKRTYGDIIVE